jgi:hydroxymethylpyrimidine pyrophosphatase-like HAD family hydrolase
MKLIVLDCDGVISKGEAAPFEAALMARLADLNRRARQDPAVPAVTLNTGRPSPYVEAVMQAIAGWQPALFENGAGLYFPETYQFEISPLVNNDLRLALKAVIDAVDRELVLTGRAYWQPGKTVCYTLFAQPDWQITDLAAEVERIAVHHSSELSVTLAQLALNIHPRSVSKGTGLTWLAQRTGIDPAEMVGVGDTAGDIDFLRLVGRSAAPVNATAAVKAIVGYVSPWPDVAGLHDILNRFDEWE